MALASADLNATYRSGSDDFEVLRQAPGFAQLYLSVLTSDILSMVQYYLDDPRVRSLLTQLEEVNDPNLIRNVVICSYIDHGRHTLFSELETRNRIPQPTNSEPSSNTATSSIPFLTLLYTPPTPSTTDASLPAPPPTPHVINLALDVGVTDASAQTHMCAYDGVLLVIDVVEGPSTCTPPMVMDAIRLGMQPVLLLNKMDRLFLELILQPEEIYQQVCRCIHSAHCSFSSASSSSPGNEIDPRNGNVCFASVRYGWAFSLEQFARMYAAKFGVNVKRLTQLLWGDHYFDAETRQWLTVPVSPSRKTLQRGFCQFVLEPLRRMHAAIVNGNAAPLQILQALRIELTSAEVVLPKRELLRAAMRKWMPLTLVLMSMLIMRIPSPKAQALTSSTTASSTDIGAVAMHQGNVAGPLLIYVAHTFRAKGQTYALARVFSGTLRSPATTYRLRTNCAPSTLPHTRAAVHIGANAIRSLSRCGAGSLVLLTHIDPSIEGCTLASSDTVTPICSPSVEKLYTMTRRR